MYLCYDKLLHVLSRYYACAIFAIFNKSRKTRKISRRELNHWFRTIYHCNCNWSLYICRRGKRLFAVSVLWENCDVGRPVTGLTFSTTSYWPYKGGTWMSLCISCGLLIGLTICCSFTQWFCSAEYVCVVCVSPGWLMHLVFVERVDCSIFLGFQADVR